MLGWVLSAGCNFSILTTEYRIYISGICSIYYGQVSTRHCQAHWHRFYCHALYEKSLATDPASTADKTSLVPDLYTIHFVVWFGDMDTSAGRSTEVFHMRSQRMILGIRWHDFVRNTEVVDRTGLPCVRDVIAGRRNSLFGHVV